MQPVGFPQGAAVTTEPVICGSGLTVTVATALAVQVPFAPFKVYVVLDVGFVEIELVF